MASSALLGSFLTTLLTIFIVAAGVIGTIFTVNKAVKILIVSLIILAGIGTFFQAYQSNRDAAFLKVALSTMLASMPETPGFDAAILEAASSVDKRHGYHISSRAKMEAGTLYFLTPEGSVSIGAVLPVNTALKNSLYVTFASGDDLKPILEQAIFGTDAIGGASTEKALESFLEDLGLICSYVLNVELERRNMQTAVSSKLNYEAPEVRCASQNPMLELHLEADFITRVKPMNHGERYGQAYSQLQEQIAKLPN